MMWLTTRNARVVLTALVLSAMLAPTLCAQESGSKTEQKQSLASRIGSRFGWGKKEPAEEKPPVTATRSTPKASTKATTKQPMARSTQSSPRSSKSSISSSQPAARVATRDISDRLYSSPAASSTSNRTVTDTRPVVSSNNSRLPRVNPRDLLPTDLFSRRTTSSTNEASNQSPSTSSAAGSARNRILRDLRQRNTNNDVGPALGGITGTRSSNASSSPRAGSVLSSARPNSPSTDADELRQALLGPGKTAVSKVASRTNSMIEDAKKSALNKSIAADVAGELEEAAGNAATVIEEATDTVADSVAETVGAASEKVAKAKEATEPKVARLAAPAVEAKTEPIASPSDQIVAETSATKMTSSPASATTERLQMNLEAVDRTPIDSTAVTAKPAGNGSTTPIVIETEQPAMAASDQTQLRSSFSQPNNADQDAANQFSAKQFEETAASNGSDNASIDERIEITQATPVDDLLLTQKTPLIVSRVNGPRQIVIGRPATYRVQIGNRGEMAADDLVTNVRAPEWAEIVTVTASKGVVDRQSPGVPGQITWRMDRCESQSTATMDVTLIARSGRPIELGVDWNHAPIGSRTMVEVQEPKLAMTIAGPEDVFYGKPQLFRLTLSNPGTGVAEDVTLQLSPPGESRDKTTSHAMGDLPAGATKSVEIELTAREAGELAMRARATANGGLEVARDKPIFCRKPELQVDWRGPEQKYTGSPATYYFRVRNPGTAVAEGVTMDVQLPPGFEITTASKGQTYDNATRTINWKVGSLRPGDDYYVELKGIPSAAGENRLPVRVKTTDNLVSDKSVAMTKVIALADLKLEIRDPKGPLPIGTEAIYEVRIKNRGSNTAEAVNVVALFSDGIEPLVAEGSESSIADGRVAFRTIDRLPAGAELLLRIKAKAVQPGTHIFRTEVVCRDLEIKLAAEEVTRFYADEPIDMNRGGTAQMQSEADRFVYPR